MISSDRMSTDSSDNRNQIVKNSTIEDYTAFGNMESPLLHRTMFLSFSRLKKDTKPPRNKVDVQMTMMIRLVMTTMKLMMLLIWFDNEDYHVWYDGVTFVYTVVVVSIHDWNWIVLPCCSDVASMSSQLKWSFTFLFYYSFTTRFDSISLLLLLVVVAIVLLLDKNRIIWNRNDAK